MNNWTAIFETGKHTDSAGVEREFDQSDLDKIIASYEPKKHEAPLVIGHPKTNSPAFGWVESLKRNGNKLYAKFKQVGDEIKDAVAAGHYKKKSISLYPDGSLRHVGLLGAAPPAVKGLGDVQFKADEEYTEYKFAEAEAAKANERNQQMDELEKLKQDVAALKNQVSEVEAAKAKAEQRAKAAEQAYAEREKADQAKAREARFAGLLKAGKALPGEKEAMLNLAEALGSAGEIEFAEGEKKAAESAFWGLFEARKENGLLTEFAEPDAVNSDNGSRIDPAKTF
jgi:hypothetical protein